MKINQSVDSQIDSNQSEELPRPSFDDGKFVSFLSDRFFKMFGRPLEDFPFKYQSKRENGPNIRFTFTIQSADRYLTRSELYAVKEWGDEFRISTRFMELLKKDLLEMFNSYEIPSQIEPLRRFN